jgi:hypothetical protein
MSTRVSRYIQRTLGIDQGIAMVGTPVGYRMVLCLSPSARLSSGPLVGACPVTHITSCGLSVATLGAPGPPFDIYTTYPRLTGYVNLGIIIVSYGYYKFNLYYQLGHPLSLGDRIVDL